MKRRDPILNYLPEENRPHRTHDWRLAPDLGLGAVLPRNRRDVRDLMLGIAGWAAFLGLAAWLGAR